MKFIVRLFKETNEYDIFEEQKIITESKKKIFMFETLTHSFADLGSTACSLVIILFLVVV